jgi:hydroxymethylpyrimidine/phosphomethylpyrimidine kinase
LKPIALTIAGSDPSGGAGIQADLKTFHQFGVYGEAVITLLTVQNTQRVSRVEVLSPDLVAEQIHAVVDDIPPHAAKTGALGTRAMVQAVAQLASRFEFPLVVDPVMVSKHGTFLLDEEARAALGEFLLPQATLITPNIPEAEALTGTEIRNTGAMRKAAEVLREAGARSVLIKGGHLEGVAVDVLLHEGQFYEFSAERIQTNNTHGTGCTYAAAITAGLAHGRPLPEAVRRAKQFVTEAIRTAPGLGSGAGPLNHHASSSL